MSLPIVGVFLERKDADAAHGANGTRVQEEIGKRTSCGHCNTHCFDVDIKLKPHDDERGDDDDGADIQHK